MATTRHKLIFALIPLAAFLCSVAVSAIGKPQLSDASVIAQSDARPPGEPKLDPALRDQLLQALNPEPVHLPSAIRNPFLDRAGLSRPANLQTQAPSQARTPQPATTAAQGQPLAPDADGRPLKPFAERYRELQREAARARSEGRPAPPVTSIYSITEIEIYGHARSGGAWIYSKPEERAFTIPVNTEFIDGTFQGFDGDAAVFKTKQGRTVRLQLSHENS